MITVKELRKILEKFDDRDLLYAYEGEVAGVVVLSYKKKDGQGDHKQIAVIGMSERGKNEGLIYKLGEHT